MKLPRTLSAEEMDRDANAAPLAFVRERLAEGTTAYEEAFKEAKALVSILFQRTGQLRQLEGVTLRQTPELVQAVRFLGGPPLSQDDLNTLAGGPVCSRKTVEQELADRAAEIVRSFLDPFRYPWLQTGKQPSKAAVRNAISGDGGNLGWIGDWTTSRRYRCINGQP